MIDRRGLFRTLALFLAMLKFSVAAAEPLPDDVARRKLAELREIVKSASGPVDELVSTTLLSADWPSDLMPKVRATLSAIIEEPTVQLSDWAVELFARRNGEDAALLAPYLAASLPEADCGEEVTLLRAVRSIGPRANPLQEIVRSKCDDSNEIVVIHAASALVRVAPTRRYPRGVLLIYLSSDRPGLRWRAADAIAHAGVSDERWSKRLEELLKDDDVRVRVTSAFALWRITNNSEATFPVLVDSLTEHDTSLATGFESPSFMGDSHRTYAIHAILDLGEAGKPALPDIISVVKELAGDETLNSVAHQVLAGAALCAIRELGPVSETDFKEIEASVACEECVFARVRDYAKRVLSSIERQVK